MTIGFLIGVGGAGIALLANTIKYVELTTLSGVFTVIFITLGWITMVLGVVIMTFGILVTWWSIFMRK